MVHARADCRLCRKTELRRVLTLTPTPPANALVALGDVGKPEPCFPLELMLCESCGHLQLGHVVDAEVLFKDYAYVSPPGMRPHWKGHAETCVKRFALQPGDLVVEIGSNNGDLLKEYQDRGMKVLGFEPAKGIAAAANAGGVLTVPRFFGRSAVESIAVSAGVPKARLVVANNVLAHIDGLDDVIEGVKTILAPAGVLVFEVQHRLALVEQGLWDLAYGEHLDYHAVLPLWRFFRRHGMTLFDVEKVSTHGGSIRCFARAATSAGELGAAPTANVAAIIEEEMAAGLFTPATYEARMARDIVRATSDLARWWQDYQTARLNGGGREPVLALYGYPAKMTTFLYQLRAAPGGADVVRDIAYVVEDEPRKIGKLTPGLHLPIYPSERLIDQPADVVLIGPWNYAAALRAQVASIYNAERLAQPITVVALPKLDVKDFGT